MKQLLQFRDLKVDSLKVLIPLSKVVILSKIGTFRLVSSETGEIDEDEFKQNAYTIKENGITTRFEQVHRMEGNKEVDYLAIMYNSKCLKHRYFRGITLDTIVDVYRYLIGLKVADFKYIDFVKSKCLDVDFAVDGFVSDRDTYLEYLNIMKDISRPKKQGDLYLVQDDHNAGLQFGNRKFANVNNPFWKIYNKFDEMVRFDKIAKLYVESVFYAKYMKPFNVSGYQLIRHEYTVKNGKMFLEIVKDNKDFFNELRKYVNESLCTEEYCRVIDHLESGRLSYMPLFLLLDCCSIPSIRTLFCNILQDYYISKWLQVSGEFSKSRDVDDMTVREDYVNIILTIIDNYEIELTNENLVELYKRVKGDTDAKARKRYSNFKKDIEVVLHSKIQGDLSMYKFDVRRANDILVSFLSKCNFLRDEESMKFDHNLAEKTCQFFDNMEMSNDAIVTL